RAGAAERAAQGTGDAPFYTSILSPEGRKPKVSLWAAKPAPHQRVPQARRTIPGTSASLVPFDAMVEVADYEGLVCEACGMVVGGAEGSTPRAVDQLAEIEKHFTIVFLREPDFKLLASDRVVIDGTVSLIMAMTRKVGGL